MKLKKLLLPLSLFCLLALPVSAADLYKLVGPDGKITYTDKKPANQGQSKNVVTVIHAKVSDFNPPPGLGNLTARTKTYAANRSGSSTASGGLRVYTASWCGYCKREKAFLKKRNVDFEEIDIDTPQGQQEYAAIGGNGVPVSIANGKRMDGFTEAAMEQFLNEAGIKL